MLNPPSSSGFVAMPWCGCKRIPHDMTQFLMFQLSLTIGVVYTFLAILVLIRPRLQSGFFHITHVQISNTPGNLT